MTIKKKTQRSHGTRKSPISLTVAYSRTMRTALWVAASCTKTQSDRPCSELTAADITAASSQYGGLSKNSNFRARFPPLRPSAALLPRRRLLRAGSGFTAVRPRSRVVRVYYILCITVVCMYYNRFRRFRPAYAMYITVYCSRRLCGGICIYVYSLCI